MHPIIVIWKEGKNGKAKKNYKEQWTEKPEKAPSWKFNSRERRRNWTWERESVNLKSIQRAYEFRERAFSKMREEVRESLRQPRESFYGAEVDWAYQILLLVNHTWARAQGVKICSLNFPRAPWKDGPWGLLINNFRGISFFELKKLSQPSKMPSAS